MGNGFIAFGDNLGEGCGKTASFSVGRVEKVAIENELAQWGNIGYA